MSFVNRIIGFSLQNRLTVLLATVLVAAAGLYSAHRMDVDVFPDLTAPTVVVMTDAHGMAAEEVERLVTFPIETAVNGAADVRRVRSSSSQGASFVWTEFDWGTDPYRARQTVNEKLTVLAGTLPEGVTPVLAPQASIMGEILMIGLQADSTTGAELRTLADRVLKPAILATGGVAQVTVIGGEVRQFQILADPQRMAAYGVTLDEVEAVGRTMSDNSSGGIVRDMGNEYALRGIARTADPETLGNSPMGRTTPGGHAVVLADVADVVVGHAVPMGTASQDASPAVILTVSKQPNANTLALTREVEHRLETLRTSLPPDVRMDSHIFRQADFIEASVRNVGRSLTEGALFAVAVLLLFLGSLRTTLISVLTIPLSLLGTCTVLHLLGMNINTMTLGGMCIAIGSLVDDAIIDVENVYKRLRHNRALPPSERQPATVVVFEASKEIRASIMNATLIIIAAFVPLFFLSGMEGRMLQPLGTAYAIALGMSLLVAMTVTPLLCRQLLAGERYLRRRERDSRLVKRLSVTYYGTLTWTLGHKRVVLGTTAALLAVAVGLFATAGQSFLPDFNEGSAVVSAVTQPGVSLEVSDRIGRMVEEELLRVPEVTGTARRTGRGDLDEHSQAAGGTEVDVRFRLSERSREAVFGEMRRRIAGLPGVAVSIGQPLGHRIDHILSGTRAAVAIKVFGPDLSRLYAIGNRIKAAAGEVEGLVDVSVEQQVETPQLQVRADRAALARYGITVEAFNRFVTLAFAGEKIGDIYEGQQRYDVVLRLTGTGPEMDIGTVRDALIDTGDGRKVPLGEVAEVVSAGGPGSIARENAERRLVVSAGVAGRDVGSAVKDLRRTVQARVDLPEGYRVEYGGQFESAQRAALTLLAASLAALAVIFLLLYTEFRDVALAGLVLLNLPFALIGGVMAIALTSGVVSIPAVIGFITLFGIATRNGILLISNYRQLQRKGTPLRRTVLGGSVDRLSPILMTALTSALALVPLVAAGDKAGNEIQSPMAIVILGGLITSTLLNLYVMPAVYEWYARRRIPTPNPESL